MGRGGQLGSRSGALGTGGQLTSRTIDLTKAERADCLPLRFEGLGTLAMTVVGWPLLRPQGRSAREAGRGEAGGGGGPGWERYDGISELS